LIGSKMDISLVATNDFTRPEGNLYYYTFLFMFNKNKISSNYVIITFVFRNGDGGKLSSVQINMVVKRKSWSCLG